MLIAMWSVVMNIQISFSRRCRFFAHTVLVVLFLAGLSNPVLGAQDESTDQADSCSEMLALFQVDSRGGGPSAATTDRCGQSVNVPVLLMASPFQGAREQAPAVCVPPETEITLSRVAEIFYGYGSRYLESLYENPYALLVEALEEEFPCQPSSPGSSR